MLYFKVILSIAIDKSNAITKGYLIPDNSVLNFGRSSNQFQKKHKWR